MWLSQLGLTPDDPTPVKVVQEVAGAVLSLLAEVERLEQSRAGGVCGRTPVSSTLRLLQQANLLDHVSTEVSAGVRTLVGKVEQLQWEVAEARAWGWAGRHGDLASEWVKVASGRTRHGDLDDTVDPEQLPAWLSDTRIPPEQEWWPVHVVGRDQDPL